MRVYLIYSVKDRYVMKNKKRKWMEKLYQAIEKAGITLYALDWELNAGKKLLRKVRKAIKGSQCVVIVLTRNTNKNPYVWQEFGLVKAYEKPIIPLIAVSGVDTLGKSLLEHQVGRKCIELHTRGPETAINQTVAALQRFKRKLEDSPKIRIFRRKEVKNVGRYTELDNCNLRSAILNPVFAKGEIMKTKQNHQIQTSHGNRVVIRAAFTGGGGGGGPAGSLKLQKSRPKK